MRTLKEECLALQECTCPSKLVRALGTLIDTYNNHDLHSALGNKTSREVEMEDHHSHSPLFVAA
jgi:hypothetical protein